MPDWQRRRYPRPEFSQDGATAWFRQNQVAPPNLSAVEAFTWAPRPPVTQARDPLRNNAAYKPPFQDGPVQWFRTNQLAPPDTMIAPACVTWAPAPPRPSATDPKRNVPYKTPFQDGPVVWFQANQSQIPRRDEPFSLRPPRRSVQQYRQLEDWQRFSGLAPPLGPDTNQINLDTFWPRTPGRTPAARPSTPSDDGWIFSATTPPAPPFDPTTQFPALDTFAQRLTYRTGRKPTAMGGGLTPPAPPFDTTLTAGVLPFSDRTRKRPSIFDLGVSEDFGVPLDPAVVWPTQETHWTRTPKRQGLYPSTVQQDAWLFKALPPTFDAQFWPPEEPFWTRPPRRQGLYPSTTFSDAGSIWFATTIAPFVPATQFSALDLFSARPPKRPGLYPHTEQQQGWVTSPLTTNIAATYPFADRTKKRGVLYPHTEQQQGWVSAPLTTNVAGTYPFADRPPKRKGLYPSTEQQDGWITKANPVTQPFDPKQTPFLYPLSPRTPKRPVLYPSTMQQDGWLYFPTIPGTGGPGGGYSPPVSRWQIQYMDEVAPLRPEPTNLDAAAAPTLLSIPGPSVQFQDIVEPPIAPPNPTPTEPEGIASLLVRYPTDPYRRQQLPEMGTVLAFQEPFYPSGSVLSWQPVYEGHAGLPVVLHPFGPATVFATIVTPSAPPGTAAYAARYPDRVGREPGRGYPNYGPSITWTPIPITPPAPPTQRKKTDLRRREQLGIRRTIY